MLFRSVHIHAHKLYTKAIMVVFKRSHIIAYRLYSTCYGLPSNPRESIACIALLSSVPISSLGNPSIILGSAIVGGGWCAAYSSYCQEEKCEQLLCRILKDGGRTPVISSHHLSFRSSESMEGGTIFAFECGRPLEKSRSLCSSLRRNSSRLTLRNRLLSQSAHLRSGTDVPSNTAVLSSEQTFSCLFDPSTRRVSPQDRSSKCHNA